MFQYWVWLSDRVVRFQTTMRETRNEAENVGLTLSRCVTYTDGLFVAR